MDTIPVAIPKNITDAERMRLVPWIMARRTRRKVIGFFIACFIFCALNLIGTASMAIYQLTAWRESRAAARAILIENLESSKHTEQMMRAALERTTETLARVRAHDKVFEKN